MKKFLLIAIGIFLAMSKVSAEQPKAQEYREILSSEKFYVEYDDKYVKRIVVEDSGRRMARVDLGGKYKEMVSILNPLSNLFGGGFSKHPDYMCYNGKYYKFAEKDSATMAKIEQLDDENLDPNEGWSMMNKELALPYELIVFSWNDKYHKVTENISKPVFVETIQKIVDGKNYTCDRYESEIKTNGNAKIIFDMCYDKDELTLVQSAIFANNREYNVNKIVIKKILREIPKDAMILDMNAKIYAAGIGDMNDLLENPVLLGKLQEVENS